MFFQLGIKSLSEFDWLKVQQETKSICPVLTSALTGALNDLMRGKECLLPTFGAIVGQLVNARKPTKMKTFQEIIGLQLWISGTSGEVCINVGNA